MRFALTVVLWIGLLGTTRGAVITHYVTTNGPGPYPYTSWATAANNIQDAVNAAATDDIVLVSNGTYYCQTASMTDVNDVHYTAMVTVNQSITIQSVNGPEVTIVDANYPAFINRCFFLNGFTGSSATVSGFTITNGHTDDDNSGGGVFIYGSGMVTNCWITGNSATNGVPTIWSGGGGVHLEGGELVNCRIYANSVLANGGAGVFAHGGGTVRNCIISNNYSPNLYAVAFYYGCSISNSIVINNSGGGITLGSGNDYIVDKCLISGNTLTLTTDGAGIAMSGGMVRNSWIVNNVSANRGGGVSGMANGVISNCVISGNSANSGGGMNLAGGGGLVLNCTIVSNRANTGGGVYIWRCGYLRNCLIATNTAGNGGGFYLSLAGVYTSLIENCTIVDNRATSKGGGVNCGNRPEPGLGTVINSIIVSNTAAADGDNWYTNSYQQTFINCCTTPTNELPGSGNITNDPVFVNYPNKNYRLMPTSPCINVGIMRDWMMNAVDLDGHARLDRFSGRPDLGCYEHDIIFHCLSGGWIKR